MKWISELLNAFRVVPPPPPPPPLSREELEKWYRPEMTNLFELFEIEPDLLEWRKEIQRRQHTRDLILAFLCLAMSALLAISFIVGLLRPAAH